MVAWTDAAMPYVCGLTREAPQLVEVCCFVMRRCFTASDVSMLLAQQQRACCMFRRLGGGGGGGVLLGGGGVLLPVRWRAACNGGVLACERHSLTHP